MDPEETKVLREDLELIKRIQKRASQILDYLIEKDEGSSYTLEDRLALIYLATLGRSGEARRKMYEMIEEIHAFFDTLRELSNLWSTRPAHDL